MAPSPIDEDMAELVIPSLPLETRCPPFPLRQYGGFWMPEPFLPGMAAARAEFEPRPSDVILASFAKSGTTWLKALAFATLHRAYHPPQSLDHPLRRSSPHDCVDFLELVFSRSPAEDSLAALPSPRLIATHMPCHLLPERVIEDPEDAGCKIVYICRDPKDALISMWLFTRKKLAAAAMDGGNPAKQYTLEEALDLFCDGRCIGGPQWHHIVDYWEVSRTRPKKVLFLRYEDILHDLVGNVRKLAEFTWCAFSEKEEAAGVAQDIVELCSIDALKNMEVNKNGRQEHVNNESFFRKGVAGDWANHMTQAMAARLDKIVEDALRGSGLAFGTTSEST